MGKTVLHLVVGLVWDELHMFWNTIQIIERKLQLYSLLLTLQTHPLWAILYCPPFLGLVWDELILFWNTACALIIYLAPFII